MESNLEKLKPKPSPVRGYFTQQEFNDHCDEVKAQLKFTQNYVDSNYNILQFLIDIFSPIFYIENIPRKSLLWKN